MGEILIHCNTIVLETLITHILDNWKTIDSKEHPTRDAKFVIASTDGVGVRVLSYCKSFLEFIINMHDCTLSGEAEMAL